jgi:hypothetical protein
MPFQATQYEQVPNGGEESSDNYTNQSTFSNNGHEPAFSQPQPYEAIALHHLASQEDQQLREPRQESDIRPLVSQQESATVSKAISSSSSIGKQQKSSWVDRLSDWWWWELASVLLSGSCFIAIVITLLVMKDKALSSWHSAVSPNALISTLATVSKASLMLAVAACISQLKWLYFERAPRSLHSMQVFDDASRGPLGALELLTRLSPKEIFLHRSGGAGWVR